MDLYSAPRRYGGGLLQLAVPITLSRIGEIAGSTLYFLSIGRLFGASLPAASLAWAIVSFLTVLAIGFLSGVSLLTSQDMGARRTEQLGALVCAAITFALLGSGVCLLLANGSLAALEWFNYTASFSHQVRDFLVALCAGLPAAFTQMALAQFTNGLKLPRVELIFTWANNLTMAGWAALFVIYPVNLDAVGLVFGFSAVRTIIALLFLVHVFVRHRFSRTSVQNLLVRQAELIRIGVPTSISYGVESLSYLFLSFSASLLGAAATAGFQAGMHILSIVYMATVGIGNAVSISTSHLIGAGSITEFRRVVKNGLLIGACGLGAISAILIAEREPISWLYTTDPQIAQITRIGLMLSAPTLVLECVYFILKMALRSLGDLWAPTFITLLAFWLVAIPLGVLAAFYVGVGVIALFATDGLALAIAATVLWIRFVRLSRSGVCCVKP